MTPLFARFPATEPGPHDPTMAFGVLIPDFPTQTHIAMWRVANALRQLGEDVRLLSTRRPAATERCHERLVEEQARTHYVWPPAPAAAARLARPGGAARVARYIAGLEVKRAAPALALSAADLARHCEREGIDHVLVHSCANAAHVAAMSRLLGGPAYSLRLGGDLGVYGRDHASKMRDATLIVAAAENNRQEVLEQVGLPPDRVITSWLGVDTTRFVPPAGRSEAEGALHLATVARLNPTKGHRHVLQAMRQAIDAGCDVEYTIGGAGSEEAAIRAAIEELSLQGRVTLVGAMDEAKVLRALQTADAFVLASFGKGEAAPVAVIEAMSAGLPIVCTIIGGTAEIVRDGVDGILVEQQDVDALARAFIRMAGEPAERLRMGRAARERAVEAFDCLTVARRILDEIRRRGGLGR